MRITQAEIGSMRVFELWAAAEGYDLRTLSTDEPNPFQDRDTRHAWAGWEQSRLHLQMARDALPTLDVRRLGEVLAQPHCVRGQECVCGGDTPGVRAGCANWWKPL